MLGRPARRIVAKLRVHELAKELGTTSKIVLQALKESGEFVKSASSTIEAPVARKMREHFAKLAEEVETAAPKVKAAKKKVASSAAKTKVAKARAARMRNQLPPNRRIGSSRKVRRIRHSRRIRRKRLHLLKNLPLARRLNQGRSRPLSRLRNQPR